MGATPSTRMLPARPASPTEASGVAEAGARGKPRALVTGGAGFIGSHLCEQLLAEGYRVVCMDNLRTGSLENIAHLEDEPNFEYVEHDVTTYMGIPGELDEVYGDPLIHPQTEEYWGNVNPVGIRGVYDEAKRYAESLTMAYHRHHRLQTRIVRIFNTYGPRMRPDDGRMIPNFISQVLSGRPLTVYGDGSQTRSVQYIDDLIEGIWLLMKSAEVRPINVGNPVEYTVREIAEMIVEISGCEGELVFEPLPEDDPRRRCPDISRAREVLGWEPRVPPREGLKKTFDWFAGRSNRPEASSV